MKSRASLSCGLGKMRAEATPLVVGQIRGVSLVIHGTERRPPSRPPSTFQTVSLRSTLAIWPYDTPHKAGILRRPLGLLRVGLPLRPAKSPLQKTGVLLTATFEEKLPEGSQEETYHHGRQGIGTSRSALVVQRGRERIYPFTSKWLKSS
jgi:hypothetical protein